MDSLLAPVRANKPTFTKKQVCNVYFKAIVDKNIRRQEEQQRLRLARLDRLNEPPVSGLREQRDRKVHQARQHLRRHSHQVHGRGDEGSRADALLLPGVVFDGWAFNLEHYVGVFAAFEHDHRAETVLLATAPLLDDDQEHCDHSAASHVDFLRAIISYFERTLSDILFLAGDNCTLNGRVSTLISVPLIGEYEDSLAEIHDLMKKLKNLNESAKVRCKTPLRPVVRQPTRWSSTFAMVKRYFEVKDFNYAELDEIAALMPTWFQEKRLSQALGELVESESVAKKLQEESGVTLLDVWVLFDTLIEKKSSLSRYFVPSAQIVRHRDFEEACVAALISSPQALTGR